jgi:hypothetical protein
MTVWHLHRTVRSMLTGALLLSGMALAAPSVGAAPMGTPTVTPTCGPKTVSQQPSPGVGQQATYAVDGAGTVTLLQQSTSTLKVTDADARSGWKDSVLTRAGTRVHVGFQQIGAPEEQERFWARLNTLGTPGTEVILVLQSCT